MFDVAGAIVGVVYLRGLKPVLADTQFYKTVFGSNCGVINTAFETISPPVAFPDLSVF